MLYTKQELGKSYVILPEDDTVRYYKLRMITDNKIKGLLQSRSGYEEGRQVIKYDITNKVSLRKCYKDRDITYAQIKALFEDICQVISEAEQYLLDEKNILLDPEYIFTDMESGELSFLYMPVECPNNSENIYHKLADFMIDRINHKDELSVNVAYQFYSMSKEETFSIRLFINIINKEGALNKAKQIAEPVVEDQSGQVVQYDGEEQQNIWLMPILLTVGSIIIPVVYYVIGDSWLYSSYLLILEVVMVISLLVCMIRNIYILWERRQEKTEAVQNKDISVEEYWDGNDDTCYIDDKTTYLDEGNTDTDVSLEWKEKGISKKYRITHYPVVIGKLINEVDCRIDDPSISRMHLKITNEHGKLFALDLNSTNGTCVDGRQLRPGEEVPIGFRSEIMLGQVVLRLV